MARSGTRDKVGPPTWIRDRWEWGPNMWPLHWCEAIARTEIDCGALAAFARRAFSIAGSMVLTVQLVELFGGGAGNHWRSRWHGTEGLLEWSFDDVAYHEAVAVLHDRQISIWDPTDNCWVDDKSTRGYGAIVAIRFGRPEETERRVILPSEVIWRRQVFPVGAWTLLAACGPGSSVQGIGSAGDV
jgi:hypothetical protein